MSNGKQMMRRTHTILLMAQETDRLDALVRKRVRALRVAQGWSLEELASRSHLSSATLSRIENGQRRLALDQLVTLAHALDTTLDQLVETDADDVVIRPAREEGGRLLRWPVRADPRLSVIRRRIADPIPEGTAALRAHPGREWFVVLSGRVSLHLGNSRYLVEADQAAEFPTMIPHAVGAEGGPADILGIFDREARRGHASHSTGN